MHNTKSKAKKREQSTHYWIAPEVNSCQSAPSHYSDIFSVGYIKQFGIVRFEECKSLRKLKLLADQCQSQEFYERLSM